jgi:hypothetical protein
MGASFGTAFEGICRRCFFLQDLRLRSIPPTMVIVCRSVLLDDDKKNGFHRTGISGTIHGVFVLLVLS